MDNNRRKFLKLTGLSFIGAALGKYTDIFAKNSQTLPGLKNAILNRHRSDVVVSTEKRWAMVIDLRKCLVKEGCRACIDACHHAYHRFVWRPEA